MCLGKDMEPDKSSKNSCCSVSPSARWSSASSPQDFPVPFRTPAFMLGTQSRPEQMAAAAEDEQEEDERSHRARNMRWRERKAGAIC